MDFFQWAITTIVGILGILAGRAWERYDRKNQKDKEIVNETINILSDTVLYCRETNFGDTFTWNKLKGLDGYAEVSKKPNFFFLDKRLEKFRKQLIKSLNDFRMKLALNSFIFNPQYGIARIPQEHEINVYNDPKEYYILAKKLNDLADDMCNSYDALVKLARQKL